MISPVGQRARSPEAKQYREEAILAAAAALASDRTVRSVTLSDIAGAVGLHKSALLRYFETLEQIFLRLTRDCWREWSLAVQNEIGAAPAWSATEFSKVIAASLAARPLFCDLLAQAPLNLERNVSLGAVAEFKSATLHEVHDISALLVGRLGLDERAAIDVIATSTSMAGALWQMAHPSPQIKDLYASRPDLEHAVVDVAPQLERIVTALIVGMLV